MTNLRINQLEKIVMEQQKQIQSFQYPLPTLNSPSKINTNFKVEPIEIDELSPMRTSIAEHNYANNEIFCVKTISSTSGLTSIVQNLGKIYSGSYDGSLKVYDAYSGALLKTKKEHQLSIWGMAIDEHLNRLYLGASDGRFSIWNLEDNEIINSIEIGGKIYSILVTENRIYCASSDNDIHILDKRTYTEVGSLKGHTGGVNSITFNGGKLISASSDKSIKIWDLNTMLCEKTISHNPSEVLNVKTGSGMLFSSNYDAKINVFSLDDYSRISTLNEHRWVLVINKEVWQLEYCDNVIFSGSHDHTIKRWGIFGLIRC
jgi:WD40 repeat protein